MKQTLILLYFVNVIDVITRKYVFCEFQENKNGQILLSGLSGPVYIRILHVYFSVYILTIHVHNAFFKTEWLIDKIKV